MKRNEHHLTPSNSNNKPRQPTNGRSAKAAELDLENLTTIWAQRARVLATPPTSTADGATLDLLVFLLGETRYGVPINFVREIFPLRTFTPVPRTPEFVVGVFSARSRLISVIDLRAFLGLPGNGFADNRKIAVVADEEIGLEIGFLVDEIVDVQTVFKRDINPALDTQKGSRGQYTQGITTDLLVVLNLDSLLNDKRLIVHEEV